MWFSKLPLWGKILFALFWPVSIPYAAFQVWTRKAHWSTAKKSAATAGLAFALLFAVAMGSPTAETAVLPSEPAPVASDEVKSDAQSLAEVAPSVSAESAPLEPALDPEIAAFQKATVVRVIDGDTAIFDIAGVEERVRFIGVDTPESTNQIEPYGKEASAYTTKVLTVGLPVYLETDVELRDRYGRMLAYIWLSDPSSLSDDQIREHMFNARLALDGYAQQMTIQPNSKYASSFREYVAEARDDERGLWAPQAPEKVATTSGSTTTSPAPTKPAAEPSKPAAAPSKPAAEPSKPAAEPSKPAAEPAKTSSDKSGTVYRTKTGGKYHLSGCQHLSQSKIAISRKDAESIGLGPCSVCRP